MAKRKKKTSPAKAKRKPRKKATKKKARTSSKKKPKTSPPPKAPAAPEKSPLEMAQAQRHLKLLEKVERGRGLNPRELKELELLEATRAPAKAPEPTGPVVIPNGQREIYVTTNEQVALPFGVNQRTVQNWKREPDWPTAKRPPMDLGRIITWRCQVCPRKKEDAEPNVLAAARARRVTALALLEEQKLAEAQGGVISLEEVMSTFRWLFGRLRTMAGTMARRDTEFGKEFNEELVKIREDFEKEYGRGDEEKAG